MPELVEYQQLGFRIGPWRFAQSLSLAAGRDAAALAISAKEAASKIGIGQPLSQYRLMASNPSDVARLAVSPNLSLELSLFHSVASLKILTSQLAMHLSPTWRGWLFGILDDLLSIDNWDESDEPPNVESFRTLLRLVVFEKSLKEPSLGISNAGNWLAAWLADDTRITFEFLPADSIRWSLSYMRGEERESAAGQGSMRRLHDVLRPYGAESWYRDAPDAAYW